MDSFQAMRIAIPLSSSSFGGAEIYTLRLAKALQAQQIEPILVSDAHSPIARAAEREGLAVQRISLGPKLSRRSALRHAALFEIERRRLEHAIDRAAADYILAQFKLEQLHLSRPLAARTMVLEHGPIPRPLARLPITRRRL